MDLAPKRVNAQTVQHATDRARDWGEETVARALRFLADPERAAREAAGECKACRYIVPERIGGAALTTRPCGICGARLTFANTNTDALCLACATAHELCVHCAADVKLRLRRRFVMPAGAEAEER